ncbi:MAG TPA: 50S ribosomal protein L17 [Thermoanaerobaculia bacterium]|nr:50S ribosomal protein L17 [Thermoanaerobaculia bacterium]
MRHQMANRKLGRTSSHRNAMFRNQISSIIASERIITTLPKAKELRPLIERMITLAKEDSVHNRRQAARTIADGTLVQKLFDKLSPRFAERPGGYTRIVKLGPRRGDGTEMAILEFVDYTLASATAAPSKTAKKTKGAAAPEGDDAAAGGDTEKTAKPAKKAPKKAAKKDSTDDAQAKPKKPAKKKEK